MVVNFHKHAITISAFVQLSYKQNILPYNKKLVKDLLHHVRPEVFKDIAIVVPQYDYTQFLLCLKFSLHILHLYQ